MLHTALTNDTDILLQHGSRGDRKDRMTTKDTLTTLVTDSPSRAARQSHRLALAIESSEATPLSFRKQPRKGTPGYKAENQLKLFVPDQLAVFEVRLVSAVYGGPRIPGTSIAGRANAWPSALLSVGGQRDTHLIRVMTAPSSAGL